MRRIGDDPDFKVYLYSKGEKIDLRGRITTLASECRPIECHIMVDGAKGDTASICFVLKTRWEELLFARISKAMLKPVLDQLAKLE